MLQIGSTATCNYVCMCVCVCVCMHVSFEDVRTIPPRPRVMWSLIEVSRLTAVKPGVHYCRSRKCILGPGPHSNA